MKRMYGYIRVSTLKQGEGVSPNEQRSAIQLFAVKNQMQIVEWFEEKRTAAKTGRPVFNQMMQNLRKNKADGVVIHKVDRSARNIQDWAEVSALSDLGIDVHFAHDNVNLNSRSSRLLADIMAVISADYSRNLSEEAMKGILGRLKQGILPNYAPYGYCNTGAGNPKSVDPVKAPIVVDSFNKYATGRYTINELRYLAFNKGLTTRKGKMISKTQFANMLRNPFYVGTLRLRSANKEFKGIHKPIISQTLFLKVQQQINGSPTHAKRTRHQRLFKTLIFCNKCRSVLTGETQKGHVYYRCHTVTCPRTSIREEKLERLVLRVLKLFVVPATISKLAEKEAEKRQKANIKLNITKTTILKNRLAKTKTKMDSLEHKFLDDLIDSDTYKTYKEKIGNELIGIEQQIENMTQQQKTNKQTKREFELIKNASATYQTASFENKRQILEILCSNFYLDRKKPSVQLKKTFWKHLNFQ